MLVQWHGVSGSVLRVAGTEVPAVEEPGTRRRVLAAEMGGRDAVAEDVRPHMDGASPRVIEGGPTELVTGVVTKLLATTQPVVGCPLKLGSRLIVCAEC